MRVKIIFFWYPFWSPFFISEFVFIQRTYTIVNGAKSLRLINNCDLIFVDKRLQPVDTVLLDCPGKDSMRLWPLPMVDQWVERRKAPLCLQVGEGGNGMGEYRFRFQLRKPQKFLFRIHGWGFPVVLKFADVLKMISKNTFDFIRCIYNSTNTRGFGSIFKLTIHVVENLQKPLYNGFWHRYK